eukprot:TRINITY_DN14440_c0_g2_i1.p1 TRINITY_DN14440_c0_g2~~TRINITY_DN14440_c0_g2_i1.p1  ORF type:complete len:169 (+),score=14.23 TRINITY_DN14440_c0_g2_i1:186-692(+)
MEDGKELRDVQLSPWTRPPPRSARSIFRAACTQGTFIGRPQTAKPTVPDSRTGLAKLVAGEPTNPVQIASAHRPPDYAVRPLWHLPEHAQRVRQLSRDSPGSLSGRRPSCNYPRHGTPNSLAYRNIWERRGAHAGWGQDVSGCLSPRFVFDGASRSIQRGEAGNSPDL